MKNMTQIDPSILIWTQGINEALTKDSGLRLFAGGGTVQPQVMRNIGGGYGGGGFAVVIWA